MPEHHRSKIAVLGGNGQLGRDLLRVADESRLCAIGLDHSDVEIADRDSVEKALSAVAPEVVINTAACHGQDSDSSARQETFFRVNGLGALNLARHCRRHGITLVHYSTDYVFGRERARNRPYTEDDLPRPVNAYGASKLAGESLVQSLCPRHYVLRIASVYGRAGCRAKGNSNFVKTILEKARQGERLKVVEDQIMSPTWTRVVACKTFELILSRCGFGLYHMAGSGSCSWYEFACEIVRQAGAAVTVEPIPTPEEPPGEALLRPRYTALENARLRQAGLSDLPEWRLSLREYLRSDEGV